jgi:hypothetical protein
VGLLESDREGTGVNCCPSIGSVGPAVGRTVGGIVGLCVNCCPSIGSVGTAVGARVVGSSAEGLGVTCCPSIGSVGPIVGSIVGLEVGAVVVGAIMGAIGSVVGGIVLGGQVVSANFVGNPVGEFVVIPLGESAGFHIIGMRLGRSDSGSTNSAINNKWLALDIDAVACQFCNVRANTTAEPEPSSPRVTDFVLRCANTVRVMSGMATSLVDAVALAYQFRLLSPTSSYRGLDWANFVLAAALSRPAECCFKFPACG